MSIRTTVTLDEDVVNRVKDESKATGRSFRETLNELVRVGLASKNHLRMQQRKFTIEPMDMGEKLFDFSYDCTAKLLDMLDGPEHR
jgi:hypothetical protein